MTDHPAEGMQGARELAMIAADCHRSKWEFDVSDENPPTAAEARQWLM